MQKIVFGWIIGKICIGMNFYFIFSPLCFQEGCMYVFGGVSKIDRVRTNCLQRVWLTTPSLQDMCWERITSCLDSDTLKKTTYLSTLLPMQFIEKLSWHPEAAFYLHDWKPLRNQPCVCVRIELNVFWNPVQSMTECWKMKAPF